MLGKAIKMNLEDILPLCGVVGAFFLLYEAIEAVVLFTVKPDTSGAVCGMILVAVCAMMNLFAGCSYPVLNVDMLLRHSVTRKTAILATFGSLTLNMLCTMALAFLLGKADGLIADAWMKALPWVTGVDRIEVPVWVYPALGLGMVCLSLGVGAVLQHFGRKAFWGLWAGWMLLAVGMNIIDWHVLDTLNVSAVVIAAAAACVVSLLGGSALILRANVKN